MSALATSAAARCVRCRRPGALCFCATLAPVATRTHVVFLQHPRERTMKMGTARMAHLGLANSELHVGVRFDDDPQVRAVVDDPSRRVALLYPGPTTTSVDATAPLDTLVVIDGTWSTARKMLARSPLLARLPRLGLVPARPGRYRIRREPAAHCLSTVEAVVGALDALEGAGERLGPLLATFDRLIETQLRHVDRAPAPYRHDRKHRRARRPSAIAMMLATRAADVVLVQAEGNPHATGGPHELVHLLAVRPANGERFETIARPRRPLAARTPERLGLAANALMEGPPIDEALAAWTRFVRPTDLLIGWGDFAPRVLAAEGVPVADWIDLRGEVARRLGHGARGAEDAVAHFGWTVDAPWAPGRGGARITALECLLVCWRSPA
jgi:DTW domain-containing protein YfiP